jgi:hypothetical protein
MCARLSTLSLSSFLPSFLNFCLSFFFPVFSLSITFLRLSLIFLLLFASFFLSFFVCFCIDSLSFYIFSLFRPSFLLASIYKCAGQRSRSTRLPKPRLLPLKSRHTADPIPNVLHSEYSEWMCISYKIIRYYYKPLNFSPQNGLWRPKVEGSKCF